MFTDNTVASKKTNIFVDIIVCQSAVHPTTSDYTRPTWCPVYLAPNCRLAICYKYYS